MNPTLHRLARAARPPCRRLLLLAAALSLGGCALFNPATPTPVGQVNLNRDTPRATYAYFKAMATNNQWAAEWSVFSPHFKRLLNQSVGRNVDAGDYNLARQTVASNTQGEMQLLLGSTFVGEQMIGPNAAIVTLESGGQRLSPRMVKLTRWELKVVGDDTPYGDFVASAAEAVRVAEDGSVTAFIRPPQSTAGLLQTFRPDQIEAFRVESQWYVDDFGGLDQQIVQQAGSARAAAAPSAPTPTQPPGTAGSPDGPPVGWGEPGPGPRRTPQGAYGSPDG